MERWSDGERSEETVPHRFFGSSIETLYRLLTIDYRQKIPNRIALSTRSSTI